jgi:outer membrane protein assembly factor BamB
MPNLGAVGVGIWYEPRVLKFLAIIGLMGSVVSASEWPQFRGPNRDAVWNEHGLAKSFDTNGLKIRWRKPIGAGWSSPVIASGRVFVTDSELRKPLAKERVHCFDEGTGAVRWVFAYSVNYPEFSFNPEHGSGPTPTPIVEAGRIYTVGANGDVHCLDVKKGTVVWEKHLSKEYQVAEMSCRPSPLIEGDLLILFTGAKPGASVMALDKKSGQEIWKSLDDHVSNSSPIIINAGGKRQLIVWTDQSVTSLAPATGKVYWREAMVTSNNDSIPTPVVQKNRLLIGGLMMELDVRQPAASILWPESRAASKRILSNTSTAILKGDYVYSAKSSGELVCLEAATGKQVWQATNVTTLKTGASINLTPCGDDVYLFTDQGNLIQAQLTPAGYREISRARLVEPTTPFFGQNFAWTPPAYANRCVFARTDKEIVCASLSGKH